MDTGQRLVDRMPSNPKKMAFISTQERSLHDVNLYPLDWGFSVHVFCLVSLHLHQQPNPPVRRRRQVSDEPNNARGRKKSVRRKRNDSEDPSGVFMADAGARGRKTSRSSHHNSRGKNLASDKSRRLTDYFHAQGNREVMKLVTNCINRITNSYAIHNAYSHIRLLSFFMLHSILCIGQYNPSHCLCLSSHTPIYRSL